MYEVGEYVSGAGRLGADETGRGGGLTDGHGGDVVQQTVVTQMGQSLQHGHGVIRRASLQHRRTEKHSGIPVFIFVWLVQW